MNGSAVSLLGGMSASIFDGEKMSRSHKRGALGDGVSSPAPESKGDEKEKMDMTSRKIEKEARDLPVQRTFFKPRSLTPRETDVLRWVARGKTNAEIGIILDMSPRTVQKHLEHIFEKLGVGTRTAAATWTLVRSHFPTP